VAEFRQENDRRNKLAHQQASHLANLFDNMGKADRPALNIVLKADVRGSLEAISASLQDLSTEEVSVSIVTGGVGGITESDRRFKDDVGEVRNGSECGLAVKGYKDVKAGDKIEVFQVNEIARSL